MNKNIDNNYILVGGRIKTIRKKAKLTQSEFAESIGIKQATLSDIERGKIGLSTALTSKISGIYLVSSDWILTGKESLYIPQDGSLINVDKARKMYGSDENIGIFDMYNSIGFDLSRELNMVIHNSLRTIEFDLIPLVNKTTSLIPKDKIDDNPLCKTELEYIKSLFLNKENPIRMYQSLPIDDKLNIIKQLDYTINIMIQEVNRLMDILKE
jgi:transcriptional regulator with XRE-family HTH domain